MLALKTLYDSQFTFITSVDKTKLLWIITLFEKKNKTLRLCWKNFGIHIHYPLIPFKFDTSTNNENLIVKEIAWGRLKFKHILPVSYVTSMRTHLCHKYPLDVNVCLKVLTVTSCKIFNSQLTWWNLNCCKLQQEWTNQE